MKPSLESDETTSQLLRLADRRRGLISPPMVVRVMHWDYQRAAVELEKLAADGWLKRIATGGQVPLYELTHPGCLKLEVLRADAALLGAVKVVTLLPAVFLFRMLAKSDRHLWRHWDVTDWRNWRQQRLAWGTYALAAIGWIILLALLWLIQHWWSGGKF
jgi:hypothetical protein